METTQESILDLARTRGLIRPLDLAGHGLPRVSLARLVRQGRLARVGRGLYALPDRGLSEHAGLAEVARRHPRAVVCLLSALRFHDITTQAPFEVWLAIPNKASPPRLDSQHLSGPLRIVRFSEAGLTDGVEEQLIDRVPVRITGLARTVADCFKYRNKIGLDVALEALKEGLGHGGLARRATVDDLWRYARLGRVANVMRPYIESLT
jgi:predicted transcriptional regulator of viral defense system